MTALTQANRVFGWESAEREVAWSYASRFCRAWRPVSDAIRVVHLHAFSVVHMHKHTYRNSAENNNNNPIWEGSVLTGEEFSPHSGELNHALSSRWLNPSFPVRTPHLHEAPTTEETSMFKL